MQGFFIPSHQMTLNVIILYFNLQEKFLGCWLDSISCFKHFLREILPVGVTKLDMKSKKHFAHSWVLEQVKRISQLIFKDSAKEKVC